MANTAYFPFPLSVEDITTDWLTTALRREAPGAGVHRFEIVDIVDTATTKIRIRLPLDATARRAGNPDHQPEE